MVAITQEQAREIFKREEEWVFNLGKMSRARNLVQHLAAFDSYRAVGGQRPCEHPADECRTWLRAFIARAEVESSPFGIPLGVNGRHFPKVICMAKLSGNMLFAYSECDCLVKAMTVGCHVLEETLNTGVIVVLQRAVELNASILLTYCLPFQYGMDRAHWEIRTIRKVGDAVVDGEIVFSTSDEFPRECPTTSSVENFKVVMQEAAKKMAEVCNFVSLDMGDVDDAEEKAPDATPEKLRDLVNVLTSERKRMIERHRSEIDDLKNGFKTELSAAQAAKEAVENSSDVRVAKVVEQCQISEAALEVKIKDLKDQLAASNRTLAQTEAQLLESKSSLAVLQLSSEEESSKAADKMKLLATQNAGMNAQHAKQIADAAKKRAVMHKAHESEMLAMKRQCAEHELKLRSHMAAAKAVEASAVEARQELARANQGVSDLTAELKKARAFARAMRGAAVLFALRLEKKSKSMLDACARVVEVDARCNELSQQCEGLQAKLRDAAGSGAAGSGAAQAAQAGASGKRGEDRSDRSDRSDRLEAELEKLKAAKAAAEAAAAAANAKTEKMKAAVDAAEAAAGAKADELLAAKAAKTAAEAAASAKAEELEAAKKTVEKMMERAVAAPRSEAATAGGAGEAGEAGERASAPDARVVDYERHVREINKKDHMIRQLSNRMSSLESMVHTTERQNAQLKQEAREAREAKENSDKAESGGRQGPQASGLSPSAAFPKGSFEMDPALENTISQLHLALNYITATARSSSSNAKKADKAQTTLSALETFAVPGHQVHQPTTQQNAHPHLTYLSEQQQPHAMLPHYYQPMA